jgi:hypothetical protein
MRWLLARFLVCLKRLSHRSPRSRTYDFLRPSRSYRGVLKGFIYGWIGRRKHAKGIVARIQFGLNTNNMVRANELLRDGRDFFEKLFLTVDEGIYV